MRREGGVREQHVASSWSLGTRPIAFLCPLQVDLAALSNGSRCDHAMETYSIFDDQDEY